LLIFLIIHLLHVYYINTLRKGFQVDSPDKNINILYMNRILKISQMQLVAYGFSTLQQKNISCIERPNWRIYWNPEPGLAIACEEQEVKLDKDIILAVPPKTPAFKKLSNPCQSLYIHIDNNKEFNSTKKQLFTISVDNTFLSILSALKHSIENKREYLLDYVAAYTHLVMAKLPPGIWQEEITDPRIRKVVKLLTESPGNDYTNQKLAEMCYLCDNAFVRLFRQQVGVPPQKFLQEKRLHMSAKLLEGSNLSLEEIAEQCGFCDRNYFTKLFCRRYEESPAKFRKTMY